VGINLVMPEDWYVPIHDFNQHMAMLDYLHGVYPKVHIGLHAGEIAMGFVKPEDLTFHIRASVERGHAERIGHGVDVMLEKDPLGLMKEMAARNVLVEINRIRSAMDTAIIIDAASPARHENASAALQNDRPRAFRGISVIKYVTVD